MFFAKYDVNGDGIFSWDEGTQIITDLDNDFLDTTVIIFIFSCNVTHNLLKYRPDPSLEKKLGKYDLLDLQDQDLQQLQGPLTTKSLECKFL